MEFPIKSKRSRQRRGLSFVEFVGCLVAMVGGVLLGSLYLGIDIQKMAFGVLEQAQVVAPGYFSQSPAATEGTGITGNQPSDDAQAQAPLGESQVGVNGAEASKTTSPGKDGSEPTSTQGQSLTKAGPTPEEKLAATRDYWDQLTAVMLAEARGRLRGEGNPEEWQLYDYLSQRKRGHEAALTQLEKLKELGVDNRLLDHGDQVIAWHRAGIKLFEHALSLLSDGPGAKLTGPFAQSWQSAATQLRMEETLVIERHKAIANYLDREYASAAPFVPAFQQQQ